MWVWNTTVGQYQTTLRDNSHIGSWEDIQSQEPTWTNTLRSAILAPWDALYIGLIIILMKCFPLFLLYLFILKFILHTFIEPLLCIRCWRDDKVTQCLHFSSGPINTVAYINLLDTTWALLSNKLWGHNKNELCNWSEEFEQNGSIERCRY